MDQTPERGNMVTPRYEITSYDPKIDDLSKLKEIAEQAYQRNRVFFEKDIDGIKINIVYSDEELARVEGKSGLKFQDWHKAVARGDSLWIFSPTLPKGSDFKNILTHEEAHIFTNKLFYEGSPAWLREGIASAVTGRYGDNKFRSNIKFKDAHNGRQFQQYPIYDKSTVFTRYLIEEFGKDKLFILLSVAADKMKEKYDYQNFCNLFEEVYGEIFEDVENEFMKRRTV